MATSIFLARLIGPVAIAGAVGMFLNGAAFRAMAQEFLRSPALIYLSGLLTMTAGLAVVLNHNLWVADWRVLLTVFGWLAAIGGAVRIALPRQVRAMGEAMLDKPMTMTAGATVWLAFGILFCFFGYFR